MIAAYNLLNDLPDAKIDEVTTDLMSAQGMRLKRLAWKSRVKNFFSLVRQIKNPWKCKQLEPCVILWRSG